jgi:putative Mn2+ efflux pump MntP
VVALLLAAVAVGLGNLAASIGIGVTGVTTRIRLQVGVVFGAFEGGMPIVGLLIGQRFASHLGAAVRWPGAVLLMLVGAQALVRSIRDSRKNAAAPSRAAPAPEETEPEAPAPATANLGARGGEALGTEASAAVPRAPDAAAAQAPGTGPASQEVPGYAAQISGPAAAAYSGSSLRVSRLLVSGLVLSLDNLVVGFALGTYGVSIAFGAILIGVVSVAMSLAGLELGGLLGRWAGERSEQMSGVILILVGAAIAGGALT